MDTDVVKPPAEEKPTPTTAGQAPKPIIDVAPLPSVGQSAEEARPAEKTPEATQSEQPSAAQKPKKPKPNSRIPKGVIIVAAAVFIGLAGAVVYVTMSSKSEEPKPSTQPTAGQQSAAKIDELKQASNEADNLPEANPDINPEITDQALGL